MGGGQTGNRYQLINSLSEPSTIRRQESRNLLREILMKNDANVLIRGGYSGSEA